MNLDKWKNWIKVKFYKIQVLEHHKDLKIKLCGWKLDRIITKLDLCNFIVAVYHVTLFLCLFNNGPENPALSKKFAHQPEILWTKTRISTTALGTKAFGRSRMARTSIGGCHFDQTSVSLTTSHLKFDFYEKIAQRIIFLKKRIRIIFFFLTVLVCYCIIHM